MSGADNASTRLWPYALLGIFFGVVLVKAEVISWFRIQEMFRFDSIHMYGVIGSAILVGAIGRRLLGHGPVAEGPTARHAVGGVLFGLGWGLTGACPGPMYALIGHGSLPYVVVLLSALAGTWLYGRFAAPS
jgi:uncharacterized membrane protein YedE/YeeE